MKDNLAALRKTSAAFFILCVSCLTLLGQGQLPPLGPPGPTMKALDEIEPRINIQRTINPLPTDGNYQYIINSPGSYYLSANLDVGSTKANGIYVTVEGVTIDLNGFQISRLSGSGGDGITVATFAHGCTIKNGSVAGFSKGVNCVVSGGTVSARGGALLQVTFWYCTLFGVVAGEGWQVDGCRAYGNFGVGGAGISANAGSIISNCTVTGNTGGAGIVAGDRSIVTNCTTQGNAADGIRTGSSCIVTNCSSTKNGTGTTGSGILTDIRASISGCTAIGNKGDGIVFSGDSFVLNNHASTNGGAGFHDIGGFSRIDGNVSRENTGMGIQASGNDTVVRNNSGANGGVAYGPTAGANWGPVGNASSTNPWTNF